MEMFLFNLFIAINLLLIGGYIVAWRIAKFIINSSEAEILAKVREYKRLQKEYENDY